MIDPTSESDPDTVSTAGLVQKLQARLLALGRDIDTLPAVDIEKSAKAINALIGSVEKAEGFLRTRTNATQSGDRLRGVSRQAFLRKIKRLVDRGLLNGLEDHD